MVSPILLIPILASFLIALLLIPFWIRKSKQIGLLWEDVHKIPKKKVAGSGGITTIIAFVIGVLLFISFRVFILKNEDFLIEILALLTTILLATGIGLIDDLLGWRKGGLSRRSRIILIALAAIPFMAINAGRGQVALPFNGIVDLGILYPLIFVPIGIVGATTTYNFLAGYNGLEAGNGVLIISALGIVAFLTGNSWLSIIAFCMVAALLAFLTFNFYPARIFPGDSLTYAIGSLIAILAILGNMEKIAVFFFIPFILETIIKGRGKYLKQSFGIPKKDGSLALKYNKFYGLEHITIYLLNISGIKATERKVVISLWIFQLVIIIMGLIIFRHGIFL
jgi:UDP-N-acetylglucosamine--dolichyl-phosphate N-acetylglucosaminephosphotransferase